MPVVRVIFPALLALLAVVAAPLSTAAAQQSFERARFLQSVEVRVGDRLPLPAWERVQPALQQDEAKLRDCLETDSCADRTAARLSAFLGELKGAEKSEQLRAINEYFNGVTYVAERFGSRDTWQSPLAFLRYAGDCEDYALAKYIALRLLGFEERDLRLVVGMDSKRDQAHAVLLVRFDDDFLVLDNLEPLGSERRFAHFRPLYAVNEQNRWIFVADRGARQVAARTEGESHQAIQ